MPNIAIYRFLKIVLILGPLVNACCEMSRRDDAIVAWHEVPGTAPSKSRPVGYGLISAGCARFNDWHNEDFEHENPLDHTVSYGTRCETFATASSYLMTGERILGLPARCDNSRFLQRSQREKPKCDGGSRKQQHSAGHG
jgi:hypothetical protein